MREEGVEDERKRLILSPDLIGGRLTHRRPIDSSLESHT
jgi:hypothetical protein